MNHNLTAIREAVDQIRFTAGDLDFGSIGKRIRGNIGGIVTRACDKIESALEATMGESEWRDMLHLMGSIFYYGGFKAETYNERRLEELMEKHGFLYKSEGEVILSSATPPLPIASAGVTDEEVIEVMAEGITRLATETGSYNQLDSDQSADAALTALREQYVVTIGRKK